MEQRCGQGKRKEDLRAVRIDILRLVPVQERRLHEEMAAAVLSEVQLDGSGDW